MSVALFFFFFALIKYCKQTPPINLNITLFLKNYLKFFYSFKLRYLFYIYKQKIWTLSENLDIFLFVYREIYIFKLFVNVTL